MHAYYFRVDIVIQKLRNLSLIAVGFNSRYKLLKITSRTNYDPAASVPKSFPRPGKFSYLTAIVRHHGQDVIVRPLVVQGLGVPDDAVHIDHERLIGRHDLVFAHVAEFRGAVPIGRFHSNDLPVYATLVHLAHVTGVGERGGVLVNIGHGNVNGCAVKKKKRGQLGWKFMLML